VQKKSLLTATHQLRHREQSAVRISDVSSPPVHAPAAEVRHTEVHAPVVDFRLLQASTAPAPPAQIAARINRESAPAHAVEKDEEEEVLLSSMGSLLQSEEEVMDPRSDRAQLQREVVGLIWLEQVLSENLNTMNEKNFMAKIAATQAALRADTSPATAAMLGRMRSEVHEFSAPFFRKVVEEELFRIRAKQKMLLNKIAQMDGREEEEKEPEKDPEPEPEPEPVHVAKKHKHDSQWTVAYVLGLSMLFLGALVAFIALGINIASRRHRSAGPASPMQPAQ